jgi:hypothetical protein
MAHFKNTTINICYKTFNTYKEGLLPIMRISLCKSTFECFLCSSVSTKSLKSTANVSGRKINFPLLVCVFATFGIHLCLRNVRLVTLTVSLLLSFLSSYSALVYAWPFYLTLVLILSTLIALHVPLSYSGGNSSIFTVKLLLPDEDANLLSILWRLLVVDKHLLAEIVAPIPYNMNSIVQYANRKMYRLENLYLVDTRL